MTNNFIIPILSVCMMGLAFSANARDKDKAVHIKEYEAKLAPLNNSGVSGEVEIKLSYDNQLSVTIEASGLEVNRPHPQHIHGFNNPIKPSACPDIDNDTNGDGIISIAEAGPMFGPIIVPLIPFDTVNSSGQVKYKAIFTFNPDTLQPMKKRTVVLHGMTVNGEYIPSLPIACGRIAIED